MTTDTKPTGGRRKVNEMVSSPEIESGLNLREVDVRRNEDGSYNGKPPKTAELKAAEAAKRKAVDQTNEVIVKTASGGSMYYFEAGVMLDDRPTRVPMSKWLEFQIANGKILTA